MTEPTITPAEVQEFVASCRRYWLLFYKKGPNRSHDEAAQERIQAGHLAHLIGAHRSGKLAVFGPLTDDGEIRGIAIFAVETLEEVAAITNNDPAVQSGRLSYEIHPYFGKPGTSLPER